jgi:hypothetical protein
VRHGSRRFFFSTGHHHDDNHCGNGEGGGGDRANRLATGEDWFFRDRRHNLDLRRNAALRRNLDLRRILDGGRLALDVVRLRLALDIVGQRLVLGWRLRRRKERNAARFAEFHKVRQTRLDEGVTRAQRRNRDRMRSSVPALGFVNFAGPFADECQVVQRRGQVGVR